MQIERDSGNRLCLRGIELPDEEMGIWEIVGQKAEARNQAGPGPCAMVIGFNFDFEHIARLGVSDSDRTGERMHLEWIELGLEVRHRPSRLNLVPAGIRHPQGNAVTWGKGGPGRDRVIPTIDENRIVEVVMRRHGLNCASLIPIFKLKKTRGRNQKTECKHHTNKFLLA